MTFINVSQPFSTLRNFLLRKNRLAGYSSSLSGDYNRNLTVHSVALVHPNLIFQLCSASLHEGKSNFVKFRC